MHSPRGIKVIVYSKEAFWESSKIKISFKYAISAGNGFYSQGLC